MVFFTLKNTPLKTNNFQVHLAKTKGLSKQKAAKKRHFPAKNRQCRQGYSSSFSLPFSLLPRPSSRFPPYRTAAVSIVLTALRGTSSVPNLCVAVSYTPVRNQYCPLGTSTQSRS